MSIIDSLITNRTGGYYNQSDMQRVCDACSYLKTNLNNITDEIETYLNSHNVASDELFLIEHNTIEASLITATWNVGDIPKKAELDSIIQLLTEIKNSLSVETEEIPNTYNRLSVDGANNIEKMLQEIEAERIRAINLSEYLIDLASQRKIYSDEFYGGEV